jgi:hypothetical protein
MKRILPAAAVALAALAAAAPALAAERRFSVTDFDRIQVDGPFQVNVTSGRPAAAVASGDSAALDRVSISVEGRTLRIRPNRSAWSGYPGDRPGPVRIEIGTRRLATAIVIGSGAVTLDRAEGMKVDLSLSGSGTLEVGAIEADTLLVGLIGSGGMRLSGKAKNLRATLRGTGNLDARGLTALDAEVNADSAGPLVVGATRTAKVRATGSGEVEIVGTPDCTVSVHGAGPVRCGK